MYHRYKLSPVLMVTSTFLSKNLTYDYTTGRVQTTLAAYPIHLDTNQ